MDLIPTPEAPAPLDMNVLKPKRPGFYTFLGVLNAIGFIGILGALGLGLLFLYSFFGRDERVLGIMLAVGVPGLFFVGLSFFSTYGFFKMKKYMPTLIKVLFIIDLGLGVLSLCAQIIDNSRVDPREIGSALLTLLFAGAITYRIHKDRNLFVN